MTATEQRCDLTDLLVDQCAHCLGHRNEITDTKPHRYPVDTDNPPVTVAAYTSVCPTCGEAIHVGDTITKAGEFWVCAECVR